MRLNTLVTGGAGYIGSHTCKALAEAGYNPIVLDDLIISTGHRWAVKWGPLVVGDIGDQALVRKTVKRFGIRTTVHFAAHAYVGESVEQPRKYFDNNVSKTLALLELLDASVDKFIFSSSCATYPTGAAHCRTSSAAADQSVWRVETVPRKRPVLVRTSLRRPAGADRGPTTWPIRVGMDAQEIRFVDDRADGLAVAPENAPQAISAAGRTRE